MLDDAIGVVAGVAYQRGALGVVDEFFGNGRFVLLTGCNGDVERLAARRCDGVNLC